MNLAVYIIIILSHDITNTTSRHQVGLHCTRVDADAATLSQVCQMLDVRAAALVISQQRCCFSFIHLAAYFIIFTFQVRKKSVSLKKKSVFLHNEKIKQFILLIC